MLADLLLCTLQLSGRLVLQTQRLFLFGIAVAPGVQRQVQLQTDHLLTRRVAGSTKVAIAAELITPGLCHQIQRCRSRFAVLGNFLLCRLHAGALHAKQRVLPGSLGQPMRQRLETGRKHIRVSCQALQCGVRNASGVGQRRSHQRKFILCCQHLGAQRVGARRCFVGVGDGFVAQGKAILCFG